MIAQCAVRTLSDQHESLGEVVSIKELSIEDIEQVGGGLSAAEGAGLIMAFVSISVTPITLGVGLGAAAGLLIANALK